MSRQVRVVGVTLLTTAALVGSGLVIASGQASRTVYQAYAVPSNGVLRLTGHGFGHGHGMSQYGAYGAAKQGLTYGQILSFYYPGTTLGSGSGQIRVLISADTDRAVNVLPANGLAVRQVGGAAYTLPISSAMRQWRLTASGANTVVSYLDGTWRPWRTLTGAAEFYRAGVVSLRVSGTVKNYRGAMRLAGGRTINVLGIDDFVRGVVAREMPASWHANALRAQAVAARTYGAWDRAEHPTRSYHTCDTTSCQVYGGAAAEDTRTNAAVTATAGRILTYGGQPAFSQFSSSSGGWTSAGSRPYLTAKADPYDGHSGNPVHTWTKTLTRAAIQKAYPSLGTLTRVVVTQRDGNGDWYGRVETLVLDGTKNNVSVSGNAFRSKFGLRSSWFRFGSGASSPTPAPTQPAASAITQRWRELGGYQSFLGRPRSAERVVSDGRVRVFKRGRIWWSETTGAHELHRRVLKAYLRRGGAVGKLGFPRTKPLRFARGVYADFENARLHIFRSGRVKVVWR